MATPVRLRDIAARARVSVATVSLALRDSTQVSAATRRRVTALAGRMGYQMHPYVSAYMSWRRNRRALPHPSVALLHNYGAENGWRQHDSASLREMHQGVLERIRARGFLIEELWLGSVRPRRLVDILKARGVSGLVFAPSIRTDTGYEFPWTDFCAIQIGTAPAGLKLPRVSHDHYQGSLDAVRRCAERRFRRPGLIIDPAHDMRLQHLWRAGFEMGAVECGFARDSVLPMVETQPDLRAFQAWLRRVRPDVIVTNLHRLVETLLLKLGRTVPGDVGLVGLSLPAIGDRVTGINQNGHLIGTQAADLLAGALQFHRTGMPSEAITTLVAGRWNPGGTF